MNLDAVTNRRMAMMKKQGEPMRWSKPKDNYLLDWFAWRLFLLLPYQRGTPFRDWLLARAGNWVFIHRGDVMCQCGHEYGLHAGAPGTECVVLDCKCGTFRTTADKVP